MKKSKSLLFRVGIIIAVFFAALIFVVGTLVYTGTTSMFLGAKDEMIDRDLLRVKKLVEDIPIFTTFAEYWEAHPEKMRGDLTEEEYIKGSEAYNIVGLTPTKSGYESLDDLGKLLVAHDYYNYLSLNFNEEQFQFDYDGLYLVDISEENCGFVICRGNDEALVNRDSIGTRIDLDISGHKAVKRMRSGTYRQTEYEIVNNVGGDSYYIGYTPVETGEKVKYAICICYDWTAFKKVLAENLSLMLVIGLLIMAVACVVLLHFLQKIAVRPVKAIQTTVREYISTKDSSAVADSMSRIKGANEFTALAGDISHLSEEMKRYTKANIKLASEQERVATELDLAAKIQKGVLPSTFPAYPDRTEFDIYASMTPAKEVGGDFYDHFLIDDDHLALVIADVSGKGVPASLFMMSSKMLINYRALAGGTPAEILKFANERICSRNIVDMFVTVWLGILEISTGKLTCSNAGHEYPILRRGGSFELMKDPHGLVLGGIPGVEYSSYEIQLNKGDAVFVYTDGAAEATDSSENMFGTDRIVDALNAAPDSSPEELTASVSKAVDDFVKDAPQFDDLTMLCLKYNGKD